MDAIETDTMVELSEKGTNHTYRGTLLTHIKRGEPVRIQLNELEVYYISSLQRVVEVVGGDIYLLDSGDGRRFQLRIVGPEQAA